MPLSDVAIRKAKSSTKPLRLFDGGGLYLEIVPSGGRWWRLKYRIAGKEKRLSLGVFPDTSLKEAREARDAARRLIAAGTDPSLHRKVTREAKRVAAQSSLEKVGRAWLKHRADAWKALTGKMIEASLENHVFPVLGARPIAEIQPREIRDVVKRVEASGAGETASRVFQRLRAIYRYAVAHELTSVDPTYPLKPAEIFKPRRTKHRAALAEREVPTFLQKLSGYEGYSSAQAALKLLLLTATRPGELRACRWEEFDEHNAVWRIPASRMKMKTEHLVPLPRQALVVIEQIRLHATSEEFVFPSPYYPNKPLSDGTLNSALARLGYKGIATAHGFRTLFSTCANEAGWNTDVIERQLAHEERDEVRGAYNRATRLADRRKLMQWWADRLDALTVSGKFA